MIGSKEKSIVDFTVPVEDPEGVYILGLKYRRIQSENISDINLINDNMMMMNLKLNQLFNNIYITLNISYITKKIE